MGSGNLDKHLIELHGMLHEKCVEYSNKGYILSRIQDPVTWFTHISGSAIQEKCVGILEIRGGMPSNIVSV